MSDSLNHESLSDDLFRNRIAAALRELSRPESDADIAAALDAVDVETLDDVAMRRIMRQVRRSLSAGCPTSERISSQTGNDQRVRGLTPVGSPIARKLQTAIVAVCASALVAIGLAFVRFDDAERPPLRPGDLLSSNDRGSRSSQTGQSTNSAATQRVKLGETLSTGPREKRRVTLLDGSVLSINEQSRVTISGERRVKLLAGEVFVEVMPAKTSERFVVETPHRTITALGTKFVVKAQDQATNVVVTQGKVQVSGVDEVIPAGQELVADLNESKSAELRPAKRSAYVVEWVKDLMASPGLIVVPTSEHAGGTVTVVDPNGQEMKLSLRKFHVDVHIEEGFARTTIDQTYFNHTWQQLEGTFRFPLPADASLSRLAMYVNGKLMEGGMVERDYGRNVFEQIRHTRRDPALLEWVDGSTFQMRVFPLEPRQEKRILLSYTQRLPNDYGKSVYRFPAGHSLEGVREWSAQLRVKGEAGAKWYSPSHLLSSRDEQGDLVIDGREEYAALDRDLVVEFGQEIKEKPPVELEEVIRRPMEKVRRRPPFGSQQSMWSVCEQDGFQYVMLRYRPELAAARQRSPQQWIFLVENSADRNDLLAETQRQIVKVLLENAEHTDTFSIIRAGTQADAFRRKPVACSLENVAAAQEFLREVAPIGALDMEQALQAVQKQVRGQREAWIVHLGTGLPVLGERDETTLLRLMPAKARYVGVAVGKRWSKSFMETAANHTGGHVTQINPDEAVAWRAFDLLSTLNSPRLTEINVREVTRSVSEGERSKDAATEANWLLLTNSLAHGQELVAVARFAKGQPLPKSVVIIGKLDGQKNQSILEVPNPTHCGHLPRTWTRLEIDRLVSLGAAEHKPQIIELSKAMYVMSPFTSLLVLETEEMYQQFQVDRGRKDHWAMYPAPAEIPVVAEQGPSQLSPLDAATERLKLTQARAKSAQSNYDRSLAEKRPAAELQRLDRLNRAEQAEVKLIEREIQRIERANTAAANPMRLAWESVVQRRSAWQKGYLQQAARYHWNYWGRTTVWGKRSFRGDFPPGPLDFISESDGASRTFISAENGVLDRNGWWMPSPNRPWEATDDVLQFTTRYSSTSGLPDGIWLDLNLPDRDDGPLQFMPQNRASDLRTYLPLTSFTVEDLDSVLNLNSVGNLPEWTDGKFIGPFNYVANVGFMTADDYGMGLWDSSGVRGTPLSDITRFDFAKRRPGRINLNAIQRPDVLAALIDDRAVLEQNWRSQSNDVDDTFPDAGLFLSFRAPQGIRPSFHRPELLLPRLGRGNAPNQILPFGEFDVDMDGDGIRDAIWMDLDSGLVATNGRPIRLLQPTGGGGFGGVASDGYIANRGFIVSDGSIPWINAYGRYPAVAVHPLAGVMQDLPSYAPGLQTWSADRLAIVEQVAEKKPQRGEVDAAARRLIEKARSLGWERCRMAVLGRPVLKSQISNTQTRTAGGGHPTVIADGSGRFVVEREVGEGLREQVINDGATLWHLYPEIGLGAKRTLSRFHQSAIQSLIPWYVPSADDLSIEADVKAIAERTVRITVLKRDEVETPASQQIAFDLIFAEGGRLDESRIINLTSNKVLAKQTIAADGTVRVFDADDKLVAEAKYERQAADAPNMVPATADLVVLPLPYRSAGGVPVSVPVNLQTNAPDFAKLSEGEALMLLATYFAEARQSELTTFIEQRFTAKGDHRIGFAVLLASVMPQSPLVVNATKQHPDAPLAKFLEQFAGFPAQGNLNGTLDAGPSASPFLQRVCSAYNHYSRWATDRAATRERPAADIQNDLSATLTFLRDCRSVDLALKLLMTVEMGLKRTERLDAAFARMLNDAAAAIAEERGLPAFGRTARIEWLLTIGEEASVAQAKELFRSQLADAIAMGGGVELSSQTRSAFVKHLKTPDGQPCVPWGELVKEAAHQLSRNARASGSDKPLKPDARAFRLIALARSCVSLSEPTLAAEIFQLGIKDQNLSALPLLNLAALEYAKQAGDWQQAEICIRQLLTEKKLQKVSRLWRDAADIAQHLQKFNDGVEFLDRAYELEFAALPKTVNLETFRQDYDSLFGQLDQRADQLAKAKQAEKAAFAQLVQRAAARWREIDVDDTVACHRTAMILTKLGLVTTAWNYWTTPLAEAPDRSTVWQTFATAMHAQQRFAVADRAWSTAFTCEPTNPDILLQHAQFLRSTHQEHRARELLSKITTGTWQPRFETTKRQAQALLTGGNSPK